MIAIDPLGSKAAEGRTRIDDATYPPAPTPIKSKFVREQQEAPSDVGMGIMAKLILWIAAVLGIVWLLYIEMPQFSYYRGW